MSDACAVFPGGIGTVPGWLAGYRPEWLRADLVAGLIATAVVIPRAMAYATVTGLAVEMGLYTVRADGDPRGAPDLARPERQHHHHRDPDRDPIGLVIVLDQVPQLLGVQLDNGPFLHNLLALVQHLPETSAASSTCGGGRSLPLPDPLSAGLTDGAPAYRDAPGRAGPA